MFKLMDRKIIAILPIYFLLNWPDGVGPVVSEEKIYNLFENTADR